MAMVVELHLERARWQTVVVSTVTHKVHNSNFSLVLVDRAENKP
jgi:hypothetical protein